LRAAALLTSTFLLPPALWTLLIWTDELPPRWAGLTGLIVVLAVVMLPGFASIWQLPVRLSTRCIIIPFYVVSMVSILFFWRLMFACAAMHDRL
jgi:hypothetical protein